ncbi:MAG: PilC/PilY family type IV pilus protein [Xanthomonadales bacterium]|nr:PilC/PilY family type IV pilus protein [Xanthomonadales bacterium]
MSTRLMIFCMPLSIVTADSSARTNPQIFADELARTLGKIATAAGAAFGLTSSGIVQKVGGLGFQVDTDTGNWTSEIYGIVDPGTSSERIKWLASNEMPAHSARDLYTNTGGSSGAVFTGSVGGLDADLVSYIRGDDSLEGAGFQERDSLIGAIVGSQPFLQRQVNNDWSRLSDEDGGDTYEGYVEDKEDKPSVLYAGSNAGVLHAFSAQSGEEMFGYVPRGVWDGLEDLADPDKPFRFTVDGEVVVTDAYDGTSWKTVLVGGLGAGGKAIYALDVSNPNTFNESEVMWEVTADDLASDPKAEPDDLGYTFAKPQVARLPNGDWAVVVGNGYGADDHQARLLVFDLFSGDVIGNIQAGTSGTEANPNGLSSPRVVRERPGETNDRWVYAGDLHGNLWRFDLSTIDSTTSISTPFFNGEKNGDRPITAQPQTSYPGATGFAVSFGTGKFFEADDSVVDDSTPDDYFFFVYDNDPAGSPPDLKLDDLADRSFTGATTGEQNEIEVGGTDRGWYVKFQDDGERLLSQPRVLPGGLGMVTYTTFVPSQDRCEPGRGQLALLAEHGKWPGCTRRRKPYGR